MEEQSGDPFYSEDSEETENINKSLTSMHSRRKINEIIIGAVALLTLIAFGLYDKIGVPLIIWLPIELLRISGILLFVIIEHRAFEKLLQKKYPLAFPK